MKRIIFIIILIVIILAAGGVWFFGRQEAPVKPPKNIESFAKCLTQKGVVMYGAYWCSHCQRQKKGFGDAFKFVKYVECTKDVKKCNEKKIEGYPTWIFKNGERIKGEAKFEDLAKKTGCKL